MSRCIIHAGTHKTGTTTVQNLLKEQCTKLQAAGINYPLLGNKPNHNSIAHKLSTCDAQELDFLASKLNEPLNLKHNSNNCLLLSAEEFSTRICNPVAWQGLEQNYPEKRRLYLSKLKKLITNFEQIDIYLCFRDQEEYAHSLYATKILSGKINCSFTDFITLNYPIFNYQLQADLLSGIGTLHIKRYEDIKKNLESEFISWLGVSLLPPRTTTILRKTIPLHYIHWLSQSIQSGISLKERAARTKFCKQIEAHEKDDTRIDSLWTSHEARERFSRTCKDEKGQQYKLTTSEICIARLEQASNHANESYMKWRKKEKHPMNLLRKMFK